MKILASTVLSLFRFLSVDEPQAQQPPPAGGQTVQQPAPQTPPAKPAPAPSTPSPRKRYDPAETPFAIEIFGFKPHAHPDLRGGKKSVDGSAQTLNDLGKTRIGEGVRLSFPVGSGNKLELTGFQIRGRGGQTTTKVLTLFDTTFDKGSLISDSYVVRNYKVSFNYLSFPAPPDGSKFRFKTLYELQYTSFRGSYKRQDPKTGVTDFATIGNKHIFVPSLGIGMSYIAGKNFRIDTRASGWAFPHRSATWDAEAMGVIRVGRIDVMAGGKGYFLKTSPNADEYYRVLMYGPYAAVRYSFK